MKEPSSVKQQILDELKRILQTSNKGFMLMNYLFSKAKWDDASSYWYVEGEAVKNVAAVLYPKDFTDNMESATNRTTKLKSQTATRLRLKYTDECYPERSGDIQFRGTGLIIRPRGVEKAEDICPQFPGKERGESISEYVPVPSNLVYVFASAPDLRRANADIVEAMKKGGIPRHSLYQTHGSDDLVLKFRLSDDQNRSVVQEIRSHIAKQEESGHKNFFEIYVEREFGPLGDKCKGTTSRIVFSSAGYEEGNFHKAFIRLEAHGGLDFRMAKRQLLYDLFSRIREKKLDRIIQSVVVGGAFAVVETLTQCSQMILLNKLSREIDSIIRSAEVQKRTYVCYDYFEFTNR